MLGQCWPTVGNQCWSNVVHIISNCRKPTLDQRIHTIKQQLTICAFEDAMHLILECCLYKEARKELKLRLVFLHELTIEALLFGDDTLTELQNLQIFKSVQLYIKQTKRFTHLWPSPLLTHLLTIFRHFLTSRTCIF